MAAATTTLPLYWHLSSADKAKRLDASVKLIHTLQQFQESFVAESGEYKRKERVSNEEDESDDYERWSAKLDESNAVDVAYAIRRLIRGLASPRENSRLGFAVTLTELLSRIDTVTCEQVQALLKNASQTSGSMTGQEERDMLFARLFGLKAIVQSGLLTRTRPLGTSSNCPSSLKAFEGFIAELLALGEKKSWLKESCWWTLLSVVSTLHDASVPWKKDAEDALLNHVYKNDKTWSPEKIALTLKLQRLYPNWDWESLCGSYFKSVDILANVNLHIVGRILKDSASEELSENEGAKLTTGPWKPQLHFVWDIILDELLEPESTSRTSGKLQDFYRVVVDECLFSSSSSPQRKYWGFEAFQKTIRRIPPSKLPLLFTKNFMRTWINHLSKQDRYLHKIARQVATDVLEVVEKDPKAGFTLVLQLTGTHGSHQFDKITKTKTVESILAKMDSEGIKEYLNYLLNQVNEGGDGDSFVSIDARRMWIVDQLAAFLRKGSIPKSVDCVQMALDWLTTHAFFNVEKKSSKSSNCALRIVPDPPFSDDLHSACREKLLAALGDIITQPGHQSKGTDRNEKQASSNEGGEFWLLKVVALVSALGQDMKHVKPIRSLDEEEEKVRDGAVANLEKLKTTSTNSEAARGAQILLSGLLLKCLCDNEEMADWETLKDCTEATIKLFVPPGEGKKKRGKRSEVDETERPPIDYIVDIMIGLLEHSMSFTRAVANMAFSMMTAMVTESTIDLILTQLERRDPGAEVDEEEVADEEENDDDEEKSDASDEDDEEDEEDEDTEGEEEEDGDVDEEETAALRKALEAAVGDKGVNSDSDASHDTSDEESMDDEQMMQIDEKLAAVFRSRAAERKKGRDTNAQREATYFKNRVLDLVDIFMKKQSSNVLILRLILPLIELISTASTDEKQLADKTAGILRSRLIKSKDSVALIDTKAASDLLESLHQRARKAHTSETVSIIGLCSLYVTRALIVKDEEAVLRIYKESISDFVTRKASSLNANFILDFIHRFPAQAWNLRSSVVELIPNAVNGFRQAQAFSIVQALLTSLPNPESRREEILSFVPSVASASLRTASESCSADKPIMTTAQLKDSLKVALHLARYTKRFAGDTKTMEMMWNPDGWDELAEQLSASSHYKASISLATTSKQISQFSRSTSSEEKANKTSDQRKAALKRKAEVDGVADISGHVKAKRKKIKKTKPASHEHSATS